MKGFITRSTGSWYQVKPENGDEPVSARLPGRFRLLKDEVTNPVAVGDIVDIEMVGDGTGSIERIYERRNHLAREATHGRRGKQIIAANIDQAIVVQAVKKPVYKTGFIDRFLVSCEIFRITPVIIINKTDLIGKKGENEIEQLKSLYNRLGYEVILSSIFDPDSLQIIENLLKDRISLFSGPSGVGKTSLLNHFHPDIRKAVSEISTFSGKGRHTTTFAELVPLPFGGYLIDTPGIREFGIVDTNPEDICHYYPEMRERIGNCKYYNCTHIHEPGCAILRAVENNEIVQSRYKSYKNIVEGLKTTSDRQ